MDKEASNEVVTTISRGIPTDDLVIEVEALIAGRVAFILGRRGINYDDNLERLTGLKDLGKHRTVPHRSASKFAGMAVGQSDLVAFQRLCSFEYLERYFHHILRKKTIALGASLYDGATNTPEEFLKQMPPAVRLSDTLLELRKPTQTITNVDGAELARKLKFATPPNDSNFSGVFVQEEGPFLRGKTIETQIMKSDRRIHDAALGDEVAFAALAQKFAENGLLDWTPDGLIHSKLTQGDTQLDEEMESRDGQLYNVTIGGPNIATSWLNDTKMQVLPLDKVFVLLVADVWMDVDEAGAAASWANDYEAAKETAMNAGKATNAERLVTLRKANQQATMTNFRVRLSTSSEMVATSSATSGRNLRMGLKSSKTVGEYIVGGWCIGTVLDAAAARNNRQGAALVGSTVTDKKSIASTVSVKIEWWSSDKLYRKYMDINNGMKTRFLGLSSVKRAFASPDPATRDVNQPGSKRAKAAAGAPPPGGPPAPPGGA